MTGSKAEGRYEQKGDSLFALAAKNFLPLIILLIVAFACFMIIQAFKKPGQMSVLESQAMDMSSMVPPKGPLPVAIARVSKELVSGSVTYTGSAMAYEDEDIYPRIEGRIAQMPVYPGDKVHKGQLLVQLDPPQNSEYLTRLEEARYDAQASEHDSGVAKQEFKKAEFQLKAAGSAAEAAQSAIDEARANLEYWTPELQREAELLKKQVISQQEYDNEAAQQKAAQAKLAQAKAQLEQALSTKSASQEDLEVMMHHIGHRYAMSKQAESREKTAQIVDSYRRIVSSSDGVVTKRLVSPGVVVNPGMLILKVARVRKMRLQAQLANSDVDKIQVGAPVYYRTSDDGEERQATVTSIFPAADPQSRTFIVEALIDNVQSNGALLNGGNLPNLQRYLFLPGQYVVMRIVTGQAEGLAIPTKAVVWKEGNAMVWKAEGHNDAAAAARSAQLVKIKIGVANEDTTEVLSGLSDGDSVIYAGQEELQPGMAVVATEWGLNAPAKLPLAADIAANKRLTVANEWKIERKLADISLALSMVPTPPAAGSNSLRLQLEQGGKPLSGAAIAGKSLMPTMGNMAGPDLRAAEKRPGEYIIGCDFSSGLWQVQLEISIPGKTAQHLDLDLEVP